MRLREFIVLIILIFPLNKTFGQEIVSDSIIDQIPALEKKVNISVSGVSLQEFLRAVANSSGVNLNVDPAIDLRVVNNFQDVAVKDILTFLERNYPLEIDYIGNIVNISQRDQEVVIETDFKGVQYDSLTNRITLDYLQTDLTKIAREITKLTGYNVILSPQIVNQQVSGYVENMPFDGALEQFAYSNDLKVRTTGNGYYILEPNPKEKTQPQNSRRMPPNRGNPQTSDEEYTLDVKTLNNGMVSVRAIDAPILKVLQEAGEKFKANFFIGQGLEGIVSLNSNELDFTEFLDEVLKGTPYLFTINNGIYNIGLNENPGYKTAEMYQFQNRTVSNLIEILPEDLTTDLLINEYLELNSLLISGEQKRINELVELLRDIDKQVPVVLIEVIIVDVNKNYSITTGIEAGIGEAPVVTKGKVFPGVDIQIGADDINKIIQRFGDFGLVNLGNVNQNFYMLLKAIEQQGILKVNSTPKLSTLNGQEANMTIGDTEYYLEEQSNIIGTQNPTVSTTEIYKAVNAELSITLKPIVSGDESITMEIEVIQSDFTERISETAPPGTVNRSFKSMIKVKNQDMIILGGLEEKRIQDSASGTPFLSRIPIIKWFFSSRNKTNSSAQLNIFIRPTIIG